jgi:hypothetical protein
MRKRDGLTAAQERVMRALPFDVTLWGGRPMGRWPDGVNVLALEALERAGKVVRVGLKGRPLAVRFREPATK